MNHLYTPLIRVNKKTGEEKKSMSRSRKYVLMLLLLFTGLLSSSTIFAQTLIAGWDFQTTTTGGTAVLASPNTPKVYNANFGSGAIYLDGTNNSSNWFVGASNSELTAFAGSTINAGPGFSTTTTSPACLALLGGVGGTASNGKFAIFSFSMVGYINLSVTYASQKSNTGFNTQIWEYSTDGINWTPLSTVTTVTTSFSLITLPTTGGLNGATTAYLRFSGTGATAAAGNNRLDNIQLNATPGVTFNTDPVTGSPFCISDDNSASVNVSFFYAGTPNPANIYTAELSSSTGSFASPVAIGSLASIASTGTISATIPAGTISGTGYRIRVTSSDPVAVASDNGTDLIIDKVVATASNNSPVCAGLSLQLFSGGGTTYSWTGPNGFASGAQNPTIPVTVNADSGEFIATAISTLGCTDTASTLAIVQTCSCIPPTITSNSTMPSCNGGANGSIDITVNGGVSPYTFTWSTGAITEDVTGLTAGIYSVIVSDAIACTDTFFVTVNEPTLISSSTTVFPPGCQGFSNGSVDLSVNGGTPGYTYLWDNGATTEDINGLIAGLYSVTITDANGCVQNNFAVVTDPGAFTATTIGFDVTCAGLNDGLIDLIASNDTVSSNPGVLISEFLANPAGTDSSKEWVELIAVKNIDFAVTPYTVIVANNGTATTKGWVQGGVASATTNGTFAFQISSGKVVPGEVFYVGGSNMVVTGRKLRLIDVATTGGDGGIGLPTTGGVLGNGTTNADGIAVFNLPAAALDSNSVPVDVVFYGSGMGSAVVNGGVDGFTLPVNDNYIGGRLQATSFRAVDPGALSVKATGTYYKLSGTYTPIRVWTTDSIISGGTSSVTLMSGNSYLWSNGAITEDLSGLSAGTYSVTVTSPTGCTTTGSATITAPVTLAVTGQIFDVTCFGLNDGGIDITVSGGVMPYSYLWNDGDINEDRSALVTGTYIVTVTDANGCIVIDSFYVNQPNDITYTTLVTNTSCFGASDGAIDLTVSGGTPPYTFSWSNGAVTEDISNELANFYFFNIIDVNGCGAGGIEFINDPNPIIINSFTPATGGAGVLVTINGSGFTGATNVTFDNVSAASFTVINDLQIDAVVPPGADTGFIAVYSSPACFTTSTDTFFFNPVACLPPSLSATTIGASCFGASDGSIDLTISSGTSPYTISWSNGANSEDIAGLTAGVYTVSVVDAFNCPNTLTVAVSEPGQLTISGIVDSVSCNSGADGSIDITVTGGTSPYTFSWSNGALTEDIIGLTTGTYTVTVIDISSCAASASFDVYEPSALNTNVSTSDPLCTGQASGSINPNVSGGTAPYTYLWSNGATSATLAGVMAGLYTVDITDANGCLITASATLTDPPAFTLSVVSATDVSCPGGNTGAIDISASNDPLVPPVNPGLLISEFLADPAGTDNPFEWVELIATKAIDFSVTPYTVVVANNGTANVKGWRAGSTLTYAFQISSGVVNPGDVFYVGGSSMAPTGTKLRTINTSTTAGDGFGNVGVGIGNGGANADGVAVFDMPSSAIDSSKVPVDAIFFGTGLGSAIVNAGLNGYTLPTNDRYTGGLLSAGAYTAPNSASGSHHVATGGFNISTGTYTSIRNWTLSPTFTDGTSAISISVNNTYSWSTGATSQDISGLTAGAYTVTATNTDGCTATLTLNINQPNALSVTGFTPGSGNTGTGVIISGTGFTAADEVWFNGVPAVFIIDNDGQISATVPAGATTGPITVINAGCDTVISGGTFTINTNATFNLTMLIEGLYDGAGGLVPALLNSGVGLSATECDTIYVELRDQLNTLTVLASGTAVLNTGGQATFTFPGSVIGQNGYIAVFHRNAVQTWSDLVTFTATTNYNFTTAATQAYSSNMIEVDPGVFAFYSGDIAPQDEVVDITDQGYVGNDILNFASGYVPTDVSGDGVVDITDQAIVDNNILNFVGSIHP
jgi:hypothetical protein